MQRLWLIFAQTVTVAVAVLFVLTTLKPEWLTTSGRTAPPGETSATEMVLPPPPGSYRAAASAALPSVVHIYTTQEVRQQRHPLFNDPIFRHFFGDRLDAKPRQTSGLGSGVIVDSQGYILTNFHVVDGASDIEVTLHDGKTQQARVIGSDPESDLAILQVKAQNLPVIQFGSMDNLMVGDVVLAIGNPFGVGQTVTMGIVSALGRSHLGINTFENFIQTDAAINPGNSGGALIDAEGKLVGINTAIYSRSGGSQGIGFAIPVSTARSVMEQIIRNGGVTRGWIGVEAQEITQDLADSFNLPDTDGALIAGVVRRGPADNAGIRPGDVLLSVNGRPVKDPQVMLDLIAALAPEEKATFRLRRDKSILELPVRIAKRPAIRNDKD